MYTSDWVMIFIALFLGGCALFVPYPTKYVKSKALSPKIQIIFKLSPPHCHLTYWRTPPQLQKQVNEPVYYFRFQVSNEKGKSRATNCEVFIEKLWIYESSQKPRLYPKFSPVNMVWVGPKSSIVDINPGRKKFFDIGHISSKNCQIKVERNKFIDVHDYTGSDLRFFLDNLISVAWPTEILALISPAA